MFNVDAPLRMSTPGHSTSGADGVGACGWLTPGVALAKKFEMRLLNDGEVPEGSCAPSKEAEEQPESRMLASRTPAGPMAERCWLCCDFPDIGITRLSRTKV